MLISLKTISDIVYNPPEIRVSHEVLLPRSNSPRLVYSQFKRPAFYQLGFWTSFCFIYNFDYLFTVSAVSAVVLNTLTLARRISFYFIFTKGVLHLCYSWRLSKRGWNARSSATREIENEKKKCLAVCNVFVFSTEIRTITSELDNSQGAINVFGKRGTLVSFIHISGTILWFQLYPHIEQIYQLRALCANWHY